MTLLSFKLARHMNNYSSSLMYKTAEAQIHWQATFRTQTKELKMLQVQIVLSQ